MKNRNRGAHERFDGTALYRKFISRVVSAPDLLHRTPERTGMDGAVHPVVTSHGGSWRSYTPHPIYHPAPVTAPPPNKWGTPPTVVPSYSKVAAAAASDFEARASEFEARIHAAAAAEPLPLSAAASSARSGFAVKVIPPASTAAATAADGKRNRRDSTNGEPEAAVVGAPTPPLYITSLASYSDRTVPTVVALSELPDAPPLPSARTVARELVGPDTPPRAHAFASRLSTPDSTARLDAEADIKQQTSPPRSARRIGSAGKQRAKKRSPPRAGGGRKGGTASSFLSATGYANGTESLLVTDTITSPHVVLLRTAPRPPQSIRVFTVLHGSGGGATANGSFAERMLSHTASLPILPAAGSVSAAGGDGFDGDDLPPSTAHVSNRIASESLSAGLLAIRRQAAARELELEQTAAQTPATNTAPASSDAAPPPLTAMERLQLWKKREQAARRRTAAAAATADAIRTTLTMPLINPKHPASPDAYATSVERAPNDARVQQRTKEILILTAQRLPAPIGGGGASTAAGSPAPVSKRVPEATPSAAAAASDEMKTNFDSNQLSGTVRTTQTRSVSPPPAGSNGATIVTTTSSTLLTAHESHTRLSSNHFDPDAISIALGSAAAAGGSGGGGSSYFTPSTRLAVSGPVYASAQLLDDAHAVDPSIPAPVHLPATNPSHDPNAIAIESNVPSVLDTDPTAVGRRGGAGVPVHNSTAFDASHLVTALTTQQFDASIALSGQEQRFVGAAGTASAAAGSTLYVPRIPKHANDQVIAQHKKSKNSMARKLHESTPPVLPGSAARARSRTPSPERTTRARPLGTAASASALATTAHGAIVPPAVLEFEAAAKPTGASTELNADAGAGTAADTDTDTAADADTDTANAADSATAGVTGAGVVVTVDSPPAETSPSATPAVASTPIVIPTTGSTLPSVPVESSAPAATTDGGVGVAHTEPAPTSDAGKGSVATAMQPPAVAAVAEPAVAVDSKSEPPLPTAGERPARPAVAVAAALAASASAAATAAAAAEAPDGGDTYDPDLLSDPDTDRPALGSRPRTATSTGTGSGSGNSSKHASRPSSSGTVETGKGFASSAHVRVTRKPKLATGSSSGASKSSHARTRRPGTSPAHRTKRPPAPALRVGDGEHVYATVRPRSSPQNQSRVTKRQREWQRAELAKKKEADDAIKREAKAARDKQIYAYLIQQTATDAAAAASAAGGTTGPDATADPLALVAADSRAIQLLAANATAAPPSDANTKTDPPPPPSYAEIIGFLSGLAAYSPSAAAVLAALPPDPNPPPPPPPAPEPAPTSSATADTDLFVRAGTPGEPLPPDSPPAGSAAAAHGMRRLPLRSNYVPDRVEPITARMTNGHIDARPRSRGAKHRRKPSTGAKAKPLVAGSGDHKSAPAVGTAATRERVSTPPIATANTSGLVRRNASPPPQAAAPAAEPAPIRQLKPRRASAIMLAAMGTTAATTAAAAVAAINTGSATSPRPGTPGHNALSPRPGTPRQRATAATTGGGGATVTSPSHRITSTRNIMSAVLPGLDTAPPTASGAVPAVQAASSPTNRSHVTAKLTPRGTTPPITTHVLFSNSEQQIHSQFPPPPLAQTASQLSPRERVAATSVLPPALRSSHSAPNPPHVINLQPPLLATAPALAGNVSNYLVPQRSTASTAVLASFNGAARSTHNWEPATGVTTAAGPSEPVGMARTTSAPPPHSHPVMNFSRSSHHAPSAQLTTVVKALPAELAAAFLDPLQAHRAWKPNRSLTPAVGATRSTTPAAGARHSPVVRLASNAPPPALPSTAAAGAAAAAAAAAPQYGADGLPLTGPHTAKHRRPPSKLTAVPQTGLLSAGGSRAVGRLFVK